MPNGIELATAYVSLAISGSDIAPQARKELGAVEREADRAGKSGGKKMAGGFASAAKGLGPLFAGVLAGIGVKDFLGDALAEARESQKVGALTANVIKVTGGAAKVTEKQVGDLASAISKKTGIDDEAVQTGANLLLTFKNVKNEVGSGSKVFDRATQAAVDLSASGFGSVDSASKMLGKALNDPLKGISALTRAGVTFTDGQKKQIEGMVKAGDVLGAQKIILQEVESQVGGAAEATATAGDKTRVAFDNMKESVGTALLPVLDRLGNWFVDKGLPVVERFGGWLKNGLWPIIQQGYRTILPGIQNALSIVGGGVDGNTTSWKAVGAVITEKVIPFLSQLFRYYLPFVATQLRAVIEVVKVAWKVFTTWRDVTTSAMGFIIRNFLGLVGVFVNGAAKAFGWMPGIGPKLKNAAGEFNRFKDKVNASLSAIKNKEVSVGVKFVAGNRLTSSNARMSGANGYNTGSGLADGGMAGGQIQGPWRGPKADNVLGVAYDGTPTTWVNPREYVTRVWATERMERKHPGALAYINRFGELPGLAGGGFAVSARTPSRRGIDEGVDSATLSVVAANLKSLKEALVVNGGGTQGGSGMGWRAQAAWVKANIPTAVITSTVRNNNPASDHDKGRAIDLAGGPGMSRIFDKISNTFATAAVRSLYHSPKGSNQIRFGRRSNTPAHIYNSHFDHVHWAMSNGGRVPSIKPTLYDQGGWLNTGTTVVQNNTGKREYVTPERDDRRGAPPVSAQDFYDAIYDGMTDAASGTARRSVMTRRTG